MLSDPPPAAGRVPVALYIATTASDTEAAELMRQVRTYAEARHWRPALAVADSDPAVPLADRRGWQEVTGALCEGRARGVVTWQRGMLGEGAEEYAAPAALVTDRGVFLAVASDGCVPNPRHSPAARRRHELADAAAGWHPDSPAGPRAAR